MIEYIKGDIAELTPTYAVIENKAGVGYMVCITLPTYTSLNGLKETKLLVHEAIREDAYQLYGFLSEQERALFRALIGVSGVGANTARMILSSIPAPELESIIVGGDHSRLKTVKGIGAKTAQRIIVDLRDKIKPSDNTLLLQPAPETEVFEEALAALTMLGFTRQQSHKVLKKIFEVDPLVKVETAIKKALAMM
ncbi:MAG: Holliday junction branch migration protein RuvA [Firmicutes bacterium]|nr:Holliday junction branch migration protein RuvA [Bacillota bacterium]MCM1400867.1 Holliday junction branch migration protein RuvA [Bacteroides sp.]MCM1477842.1 Holliday junction branch migration protein RuvA [Bacteroides sp.]